MPDFSAPGVTVLEVKSSILPINPAPTDVTAFLGATEKGPLNRPLSIGSMADYQALFGGQLSGSYVHQTVRQFFENGGRQAYVSRVVGASGTVAASRQLQNSTPTNSVLISAFSVGDHGNLLSIKAERIDKVIAGVSTDIPASAVTSCVLTDIRQVYVGATLKIVDATPDTIRFVVTRIDRSTRTVYFASLTPAGIVSAASAVVTLEEFRITVYRDGTAVRVYPQTEGMAYNSTAGSKYFVNVINTNDPANEIVVTTDNAIAATSAVDPRPATDSAAVVLTSGSDGAAVTATEIIGSSGAASGFYAYDSIQDAPLGPYAPGWTSAAYHQAVIAYVEARTGNPMFAVLDAPSGLTGQQLIDYVQGTAMLYSERAGIYGPWVKQVDPLTNVITSYPPGGFVLGTYARITQKDGVQRAPAGSPHARLNNVVDLERRYTETELGALNRASINAVRVTPNGICVMGARTLSRGDFQYVNVRRVFNFVNASLRLPLLTALFESNDEATRAAITRSISSFLTAQWNAKVLKGASADQAFVVTCDETNNPPSVVNNGQLAVAVALAVANPAEFIVLSLSRDLREQLAELAAAGV